MLDEVVGKAGSVLNSFLRRKDFFKLMAFLAAAVAVGETALFGASAGRLLASLILAAGFGIAWAVEKRVVE